MLLLAGLGVRAGINATPTVLVNGKPLPQPTPQTLREAVQRAS